MTPPSVIEFDHVTKRFGAKTAVDDLSLSVQTGELFCFLGPNGAGKSSTIQMLMGLKAPTSGDIRINGVSVRSPGIHGVRRGIGYLPEQPVLYDYLTGREFVQFVAQLQEAHPLSDDSLDAAFARFELANAADALVKTYSMGMKKKIALLAALTTNPALLVLDEPTGALDAASAREVKDLMVEARRDGKAVFFTTHVMEIAEQMADRLAIIDAGALLAVGTLSELRLRFGTSPDEPLERIFLRLTGRGRVREQAPQSAASLMRPAVRQ